MTNNDESIMEELIAESKEHLLSIEPDLMALEENPSSPDPDAINRIFRAVHSIKGGFGFFSMNNIKNLAHTMENIIGLIRDGSIVADASTVDALLEGTDKLRVMIDDVQASEQMSIENELKKLENILSTDNDDVVSESKPDDREKPDSPGARLFCEALEILSTDSPARLPEIESSRLSEILKAIYDIMPEDRHEDVEDILNDYEACESAMGLDLVLRPVFTEKLKALEVFLAETPASDGKKPDGQAEAESDTTGSTEIDLSPAVQRSAGSPQSLRVKVDLLDNLMNLAGELVLSRNRIKRTISDRLSSELTTSNQLLRLKKQLDSSCQNIQALVSDSFHTQAIEQEFNEISRALNNLLDCNFSDLPGLSGAVQDIDTVTSELQGGIMYTRMQPVSSVFSKFPRVIRDMSRKLGKDISLEIQGENVELDKSIVEALSDPLTHLIRNSADHGIESPAIRKAQGKSPQGKIELIARHEGGQVFIEIIDNGAGIDPAILKRKALEKELITTREAETMTDREALRLIFAPGFSTAEVVSDVSGRGVGMDVVRTNIERIGGTIDINSTLGKGCRISLKLPLTLAIMPALVIENEKRVFAIPQVDIEELVRVRAHEAHKRIENLQGNPVIRLRDKILPLVSLNGILDLDKTFVTPEGNRVPDRRQGILDNRSPEVTMELSGRDEDGDEENMTEEERRRNDAGRRRNRHSAFNIIVLRSGPNRYGLIVEALRDSEEIVVKSLPEYLKHCEAYAGATIMGDGSVAMILDAVGMAENAGLHFGGELESAEATQSDIYKREVFKEKQSLLLFQNGGKEKFAVNMSMIKRIEKIKYADIEQVNDKKYLKYEDSSIRLICLHDFMPVSAPERKCEECYVLIPAMVRHPMGILVTDVNDVLETVAVLDRQSLSGTGILGTFVQNGSLYMCLDIYSLFETAEPEIFAKQSSDSLKGKRILLAEDTAFFRTVESAYLEQLGCHVTTATDGEDAWQKLSADQYDLLLTDINMPFLDGIGLAHRLRASEQYARMPIIALTSLTNDNDRERIMAAGVDAFEGKLDKESLRITLENLLASSAVR